MPSTWDFHSNVLTNHFYAHSHVESISHVYIWDHMSVVLPTCFPLSQYSKCHGLFLRELHLHASQWICTPTCLFYARVQIWELCETLSSLLLSLLDGTPQVWETFQLITFILVKVEGLTDTCQWESCLARWIDVQVDLLHHLCFWGVWCKTKS